MNSGDGRPPRLDLEWVAGRYAICRLSPEERFPAWVAGPFVTISRTPEELSVVSTFESVPEGVRREGPYRLLRIAGSLVLTLTGIFTSLADPLAAAGVPIFAVSTFDTDYLLIREPDGERASAALIGAGHRFVG